MVGALLVSNRRRHLNLRSGTAFFLFLLLPFQVSIAHQSLRLLLGRGSDKGGREDSKEEETVMEIRDSYFICVSACLALLRYLSWLASWRKIGSGKCVMSSSSSQIKQIHLPFFLFFFFFRYDLFMYVVQFWRGEERTVVCTTLLSWFFYGPSK